MRTPEFSVFARGNHGVSTAAPEIPRYFLLKKGVANRIKKLSIDSPNRNSVVLPNNREGLKNPIIGIEQFCTKFSISPLVFM